MITDSRLINRLKGSVVGKQLINSQTLQDPLQLCEAPLSAGHGADTERVQLLHDLTLTHALGAVGFKRGPHLLGKLPSLLLLAGIEPVNVRVAELLALGLCSGKSSLGTLRDKVSLHLGSKSEQGCKRPSGHIALSVGPDVFLDGVDHYPAPFKLMEGVCNLPDAPAKARDFGDDQHVTAPEVGNKIVNAPFPGGLAA